MTESRLEPIVILLVEDNPADARLTAEGLKRAKVLNRLHVVEDGVAALDFLYRRPPHQNAPRPDLILLDLNLPKMDGRQVLVEIKHDPALAHIPVVILTTSEADRDVLAAYEMHASCYVVKPVGLNEFVTIVKSIENFWLAIVTLPPTIERRS